MKALRLPIAAMCTLLVSCGEGGVMVEETPVTPLGALYDTRIFFGHQSVGRNIIEGIGEVLQGAGARGLVFVETRDPGTATGPGFRHAAIGRNDDPLAKIRDFDAIMRGGMADAVDVAFMKLCYVDIRADTDVGEVFRVYRDTMAGLRASFPRTTFVNLTVPLVTREKGLKSLVKRLLGRPLRGYADNLARENLNRLLRDEYEGTAPLFDLARLESTRADGSRAAFEEGGVRYYALEEAWSDDGGHLNGPGRRFIADRLLVYLAGLER